MDKILLYQKLNDITPEYHRLLKPYTRPSIKRVQFNLKELELHYYERFKTYLTAEKLKKITGGSESNKKVKVIQYAF